LSSDGQSRASPDSGARQYGFLSGEAHTSHPLEVRVRESSQAVIDIEERLLSRLRRLQTLESRLVKLVARRRQHAGRRAVRQIERERNRLGRELHTGVGQLLASIRIQVDLIEAQLPSPPEVVREALDRISMLAATALEEVRGVSKQFYAPEWQRLSLDQAIQQLVETSGLSQRFGISLAVAHLPVDPDPDIKTLFYRAAQEGLSNIARHSQATQVMLALESSGGGIRLTVKDNGGGFEVREMLSGPAGGGIGLRSLREQAADLEGKALVHSGPEGTTLEVFVPMLRDERTQEQ
jgi:two-component system NarL family sensor kinase